MPRTSWRSVVLTRWATAPGARPWCASPQPTRPSAVVTLTTTASRFTARPMPSVTPASGASGNEVGYARTSAIFTVPSSARLERGVVAALDDELAEVPPLQEADERLRSVLEADGDVLPGLELPLPVPLGAVAEEVGKAVEVVGDDEALDEDAVDEDGLEVRPRRQLGRVVLGDQAAERDARPAVHELQHGGEHVAAHVVEVDVDPAGARLPERRQERLR